MVDANREWVASANTYYREKLGSATHSVRIVSSFVTVENINQLFLSNSMGGEIDLLSIDIDGNDYWVWKAIDIVKPRVVIMEYNAALGMRSLTISYNPRHTILSSLLH